MNFNLREFIIQPDAGEQLRRMHQSGELAMILPEISELDLPSKHHKDMLEHSIRVLENAQELSNDKNDHVLFIAALFHDVGKPKTRKIQKGKASFMNHEHVGASMCRRILKRYGLSKNEIQEISVLVLNHMRGHTFAAGWSDSAIRRLAKEAGSAVQVERLGVIFGSDATTKNIAARNRFRANAIELRDAMLEIIVKDEKSARRPAIDGHRVMELLDIKPGKNLGEVMRFLNSEEGLKLSVEEAEKIAVRRFGANG